MFYNTQTMGLGNHSSVDVNQSLNNNPKLLRQPEASNMFFFQQHQDVPILLKGSNIKHTIDPPPVVSPSGSLDSVGSFNLSTIDNSCGDNMDGGAVSSLRYQYLVSLFYMLRKSPFM